jgi:hypothetical protein
MTVNSIVLGFLLIFYAIVIAIWGYILHYLLKLEKIGCECSKDWKRKFIMYYIIVIFIFMAIQIISFVAYKAMHPIINTIIFLGNIFFAVIVFKYIHELRTEKCECSEDQARDLLELINYIQIALLIFILVKIIYGMFTIQHTDLKTNLKTLKSMNVKAVASPAPVPAPAPSQKASTK